MYWFPFEVPDIYFTVRQTTNIAVPLNDSLTFNHVISNVGGGYISTGDDNSKFITPVNGKGWVIRSETECKTRLFFLPNGVFCKSTERQFHHSIKSFSYTNFTQFSEARHNPTSQILHQRFYTIFGALLFRQQLCQNYHMPGNEDIIRNSNAMYNSIITAR